MPEPSHRDVLVASPAKEAWGWSAGNSKVITQWPEKGSYSSSKLVAQDTTLLRNAIAPVL